MVFRIWLAWSSLVFAAVVVALIDLFVVTLTKTQGFLTGKQLLVILAIMVSWIVAQVIFGLFSKEGVRRT